MVLDLHRKFLKNTEESSSSRSSENPRIGDLENLNKTASNSLNNSKLSVPRLDLTPARKIQAINVERMANNEQAQTNKENMNEKESVKIKQ